MYENTFANGPVTGGNVAIAGYINGTERDTIVNQTDVTYRWDMGQGIRHTLLAGTELTYQETDNFRNNASFVAPVGSLGRRYEHQRALRQPHNLHASVL